MRLGKGEMLQIHSGEHEQEHADANTKATEQMALGRQVGEVKGQARTFWGGKYFKNSVQQNKPSSTNREEMENKASMGK